MTRECNCNQGRKPCTCKRHPEYETVWDCVIVVVAIVGVGYWVAGWLAGAIR